MIVNNLINKNRKQTRALVKNKIVNPAATLFLLSMLSFNLLAQEISIPEVLPMENNTIIDLTELATTTEEFIFDATTTEATTTEISIPEILASSTEATTTLSTTTLPVGTTTIETGVAVVLANVINIVNTNLINSTGTVILENLLNGTNSDLDFRPTAQNNDAQTATTSTTTTICSLLVCNGVSSTTVEIVATSSIQNDIVLDASSGYNLVDTVENANINTGDTLAGLNLVNVANTNIIDSNYLLLSLNSFNDINGDIILPALTNFANFSSSNSDSNSLAINDLNVVQTNILENNLDVTANSGENKITESQNAVTSSGQSTSVTNVYNNINTFLVGGNSIAVLLRVAGEWIGELIGLPATAAFVQQGDTRILNYSDTGNNNSNILNLPTNILSVNSTNTSSILNNLKVNADSGNNQISNTENANINTGNSLAAANVINIGNANIINRNWILAIINIFGNFHGNIVFAAPKINTIVTSTTTVTSTATTSEILLTYSNPSGSSGSGGSYDTGNINTSNISVSESLNINLNNNAYDNLLALQNNIATNTEKINEEVLEKVSDKAVKIYVIRKISGNKQELRVKNLTNFSVLNASFEDILYDPFGRELKKESWEIGEMLANEEIVLTYDVVFGVEAISGTYSFASIFNYKSNGKNEKIYYKQNGKLDYLKTKTIVSKKIKSAFSKSSPLFDMKLGEASEMAIEEKAKDVIIESKTVEKIVKISNTKLIYDFFVSKLISVFTYLNQFGNQFVTTIYLSRHNL